MERKCWVRFPCHFEQNAARLFLVDMDYKRLQALTIGACISASLIDGRKGAPARFCID